MASIKFKDGSQLNIWEDTITVKFGEIFKFPSSVFYYHDPRDNSIHGQTKEDLSGRKWLVSNGLTVNNLIQPSGNVFNYTTNIYGIGPRITYHPMTTSYIGELYNPTPHNYSVFETFPRAAYSVIGYFIETYNKEGTIEDFYRKFAENTNVKQIVVFQVFPKPNGISDAQITLLKDDEERGYSFGRGWYGTQLNVEESFGTALDSNPYVPNPYEPGGPSGEGGGGGSFDKDSDLIPDSSLPSISAANTGFTRIYNPTLAQVQDLARYLWTDESVIETIWNHIKQYFESPMEAILGFNLVPVPVPNGGVEDFALMYIKTGVMMNTAANQFVDLDCGTFELKPYYGSALDYSPYTKVSCFLPYIGTVQLNTDEVMGATLQIKYRVDICSGSCVAKIFVNGSCLYQYSGHCAINIPISASDFSSYVSSAISVAKLAIGAATGAGMAAAASVLSDPVQQTNQVVTRTTTTTETARNPLSGRQITTGTRSIVETTERPANVSSTQASFDGLTPSNISNTVGQIMGSKPHVEHSGSFSGNTGYLGVRRPFLIIERPNMCMPEQYQQFNGFPAMITMPLSECTGFTQVQQVQFTGMEATNPEQSEILQMLKTGVIL